LRKYGGNATYIIALRGMDAPGLHGPEQLGNDKMGKSAVMAARSRAAQAAAECQTG